jgi:hypothetical protein
MFKSTPSLLLLSGLGLLVACGGKNDSSDKPEEEVIIVAECLNNNDCVGNATGPICDLDKEVCVAGCLQDGDCTQGANTQCDTATNSCVAPPVVEELCKVDQDCAGDPAGPTCNVTSGECEPFVCTANTDCTGDTPICNVTSGVCEAGCLQDTDCTDATLPLCDVESNECVAAPVATLIGTGDGSVESVEFVKIYEPSTPIETTDIEFHPERDELWVLNREFEVPGLCTEANFRSARCNSMWGTTTLIKSPGSPFQSAEELVDGNAWHFMRRPTSLAMNGQGGFGTCGEAATGNFEDNDVMFIGPSLWSTDLDVYAQPSGGNGSHLDMLHATPWCMGMAHERDNVFWVFNGHVGAIDRYDFHEDHGPGADDHSDGEIFRYVPGQVKRLPNVPSHMVFNDDDAHLYIVDTGNARLVKLDTTIGTLGGPFTPVYEPLASYGFMEGTMITEVVANDVLVQPSGLELHEGTLYVSDHATGMLHAFDLEGNLLRSLQTPLGEGSLAGIDVGPKGKLWFADMKTGAVYTIRPKP